MKCIFTLLLDFILKVMFFLIAPIFSLLMGQWSGTLMKKSVTIFVLILIYYVLINVPVVQETFSGWYSTKVGCPFAMCSYEGPYPRGGRFSWAVRDPIFLIVFAIYFICYMWSRWMIIGLAHTKINGNYSKSERFSYAEILSSHKIASLLLKLA